MPLHPGHLQFGAGQGRLTLLTTRDGLAATAGHDLTIELTEWSAELDVADDLAPAALTVRADLNSFAVREGRGGVKPLTDRDRREIAATARKLLRAERFPVATFTASRFEGNEDGGTIEGTLSLAGSERPLRLTVVSEGGGYHATSALRQTDFGIKPYSAFLGALKVSDEVRLEIDLDLQ